MDGDFVPGLHSEIKTIAFIIAINHHYFLIRLNPQATEANPMSQCLLSPSLSSKHGQLMQGSNQNPCFSKSTHRDCRQHCAAESPVVEPDPSKVGEGEGYALDHCRACVHVQRSATLVESTSNLLMLKQ
eukprot:1161112-Pelagomonas_calceolata.AAC.20